MNEHAWQAALDKAPCDWPTRLAYADWLEDLGQNSLAFAQRWMARHRKAPGLRLYFVEKRVRKPWAWYLPWMGLTHLDIELAVERDAPACAILPRVIYASMRSASLAEGRQFYEGRLAAEMALTEGLESLRAALDVCIPVERFQELQALARQDSVLFTERHRP